jgi:hypothetical protein
MRNLFILGFLLGCSSPAVKEKSSGQPKNLEPTSVASVPGSMAAVASAPTSAPFEDPVPRWATFFKERFNTTTGASLVGDFNGDGGTDVAVEVDDSLLIFYDTKTTPPTEWETLKLDTGTSMEVKTSAWAQERLPQLKGLLSEKQSVLVIGGAYPVVYFWYAKESSYAWLQVIPAALEPLLIEANKLVPFSLSIKKNNLFSQEYAESETNFSRAFIGDFNGDKDPELVVVQGDSDNTMLWHFLPGGASPKPQRIDYSCQRMSLHFNAKPTKIDVSFESDDVKPGAFTINHDYLEAWKPEASSVFLVFDKGTWKIFWLGD